MWSVSRSLHPPYPIQCCRANLQFLPLKTNIHMQNIERGTGAMKRRLKTITNIEWGPGAMGENLRTNEKTVAGSQKFFLLILMYNIYHHRLMLQKKTFDFLQRSETCSIAPTRRKGAP